MARRGTLLSPDFPSSYPPNSLCVWNIRAPIGHYLTFQVPPLCRSASEVAALATFIFFCGSSTRPTWIFHAATAKIDRIGFSLQFTTLDVPAGGGNCTERTDTIEIRDKSSSNGLLHSSLMKLCVLDREFKGGCRKMIDKRVNPLQCLF